ncbi:hypothetical protein GIB67_021805 [Kingdonia uniflora]|uniref:CRAL/TRIO N-terminal domain-containing protein n=1 Tax=Kingdonia uniflora TaxID=39325 RepID=A0A7J7P2N4_9MAGN|nr:hypothetical protein GIB67_021805 [Kingdonia uniflora]
MNPLRYEVAAKSAQGNNETEQTKVRLMRANVEKQDPSAKPFMQDVDDLLIRRFLRSRKLDIEKASTHFLKYLEWKARFVPNGSISESEIPSELGQNKVFLSGWDKTRRPISVVLGGRHVPTKDTEGIEGLRRLMVYSLDKICACMSRPNEKFVTILDLEGWGYKNCDIRGYIGCLPIMQARSPGRVNLIREHIDYKGCSVLPMAIRQDTIVVIRKHDVAESPKLLRIANVNVSLDVLVDEAVPTGSGLSSSAAFVYSSTVAIMAESEKTVMAVTNFNRQIVECPSSSYCACHKAWNEPQFLLGFVFQAMWYNATVFYFGNYYHKDPREMAGLAASAIAEKLNQVLMEKKESKSGMEILNLFKKEGRPRGTWNGKKADSDFCKMIVNAYEVKKQELTAENEQLRALLHSMQVINMVAINNVLSSWGVRLKLYNLWLKVVQCDRPIVCTSSFL